MFEKKIKAKCTEINLVSTVFWKLCPQNYFFIFLHFLHIIFVQKPIFTAIIFLNPNRLNCFFYVHLLFNLLFYFSYLPISSRHYFSSFVVFCCPKAIDLIFIYVLTTFFFLNFQSTYFFSFSFLHICQIYTRPYLNVRKFLQKKEPNVGFFSIHS